MDTIVRPPLASGSSTASRRRRWPIRLLLASLVLVLIGASSWLANIEPIARGSSSFGTRRADVRTIKVDAFDITGHVFEVPAETGQPFRYRFSMRNAGPMPVTTC